MALSADFLARHERRMAQFRQSLQGLPPAVPAPVPEEPATLTPAELEALLKSGTQFGNSPQLAAAFRAAAAQKSK